MQETGKYNGGQKVFFYTSALASLGLLVSGLVLFWPESFPTPPPLPATPTNRSR